MPRVAILSDIHGNLPALEAVLADAARRGALAFINLGDTLYGPLWPEETAARLMALNPCLHIRGNQDRATLQPGSGPLSPTAAYVQGQLSARSLAWLAGHPAEAVYNGGLYLCHGAPGSDETYLLETPTPAGPTPRPVCEIQSLLGAVAQQTVLCGHSHTPRLVRLPGDQLALNPGSVGLPAYTDDHPPHTMQTGSPHARYALLEKNCVTFHAVTYPWAQAAQQARLNARPDWAAWLETGWG